MLFYADGARVPLPEERWRPGELIFINEPRSHKLAVQVLLADPNDQYERAEVRLRYSDANRVLEHELELTEHGEDQVWEVRLEDPTQRAWQYRVMLVRTDGGIETVDWTDGPDDVLIVGVQAAGMLRVNGTVLVIPDGADVLATTVELHYDDDDNDVSWSHTEMVRPGHSGTFEWVVPLLNPDHRTYRYRISEFRTGGRTDGPWVDDTTTALVILPLS